MGQMNLKNNSRQMILNSRFNLFIKHSVKHFTRYLTVTFAHLYTCCTSQDINICIFQIYTYTSCSKCWKLHIKLHKFSLANVKLFLCFNNFLRFAADRNFLLVLFLCIIIFINAKTLKELNIKLLFYALYVHNTTKYK